MAEFVDEYLTISKPSEGFFKDRGSKFLAFAYPVSTEEEIKQHQEQLRSDYHDARHHCYAYMLGKIEMFSEQTTMGNHQVQQENQS